MDCEEGYKAGPCQPPAEREKEQRKKEKRVVPVLAIPQQILVFVGRKTRPSDFWRRCQRDGFDGGSVYLVDSEKRLMACLCPC